MRSLLSLAGLLVACAGTGLFIAIGISVWSIKSEVNRQTDTLSTRANETTKEADKAIAFVDDVIRQAGKDLEKAREQSEKQPTQPVSFMERMVARKASQELAGSVDRAHLAVVTASDAVVVAEAALDVFNQSSQFRRLLNIPEGQVDATRTALGRASGELRQAQTILGVPIDPAGGAPTPEQLNAVDNALGQARNFTNELTKVVTTVRGRINETRTTVDRWTLILSISISLLCALAAVGQVFMARFFLRKLRGRPA